MSYRLSIPKSHSPERDLANVYNYIAKDLLVPETAKIRSDVFYDVFTNNRVYRYVQDWSEVPGSAGARAISYAGGTLYIAYSGGIWTYHPASGDWS